MKLSKQGETFTYKLDDRDLHTLTKCLLDHHRRASIYHREKHKVIGLLEFTTMQFRPMDREAVGLDPIDLEGTTEVFIEYN